MADLDRKMAYFQTPRGAPKNTKSLWNVVLCKKYVNTSAGLLNINKCTKYTINKNVLTNLVLHPFSPCFSQYFSLALRSTIIYRFRLIARLSRFSKFRDPQLLKK